MSGTTGIAMIAVLLAGACAGPEAKRREAEKAREDVDKAERQGEKDVAEAKRKADENVARAEQRAQQKEEEAQAAEARASSVFTDRVEARLELVDQNITALRSAPLEGLSKDDAIISLLDLDVRRARLQQDVDKLETTKPEFLAEAERNILDALTTLEKDAADAASKAKASSRT